MERYNKKKRSRKNISSAVKRADDFNKYAISLLYSDIDIFHLHPLLFNLDIIANFVCKLYVPFFGTYTIQIVMFKYNKDGVSILTVQDTRKEKKSGLFPVKIQVIYKRVQRYYSTGKELSPEEWAALSDTKSKRLISIRSEIKNSFEKVEAVVKMLVEEGNFSYDALNLRLGKGVGDTVNILFKAKLDALMEEGSVGNALANRSAYKHLENYAGANIPFETVSADWLKKYEKAMIEEGKSYATISIYLRCLRAIFNDAKTAGIIKENQYPFGKGKYEIPIGKGRKMAL
ncbi:MAG: phage integrase SAM-like domain-containing protein, partial [Tannerella sp.]|nr:phage integrase SAM-like domain-containing protein [Tannerella sp.]